MKKLVAKNFVIYAIPSVISRFIPIITLPITTKYLSLSDFGYIAIFDLCTIPFIVFLSFGQGYIINAIWFKLNDLDRGKLIFSLLVVSLVISVLGSLIIFAASNFIFPLIAGNEWGEIKDLFPLLLISVIGIIPGTTFTSWVIIEQKAKLSSLIKILQIVISSIVIVFVAIYTQDYKYIIIGLVLTQLFIGALQLLSMVKTICFKVEMKMLAIIYKIGTPIFLRSVFNVLRTQFDRIIVSNIYGANQFALYNFSGKVNNIFIETSEHFQNAYDPSIYMGLTAKKTDTVNLRFIFHFWGILTIIGCLILILFGETIIDKFTNGIFTEAFPLILLYTCVVVITLPFMGLGQVIIFFQESKYLLLITIIQALVIFVLAIILIPIYGAPAGVFSLWFGTLIYMLMYFYKKRQLFKEYFVEKIMVPYVLLYHLIVLFTFFNSLNISYILMVILFCAMIVRFYKSNKILLKEIWINKKAVHSL